MTSLFQKATTAHQNKFAITVPNAVIYLFFEETQPRVLVASQTG
jgi:hypothetical protein